MNEKIKQLAEQAEKYANEQAHRPWHHSSGFNPFKEKFAELIVKECADICDDAKTAYTKLRKSEINFNEKDIWAEGETASDAIKNKIKQHFGVAE